MAASPTHTSRQVTVFVKSGTHYEVGKKPTDRVRRCPISYKAIQLEYDGPGVLTTVDMTDQPDGRVTLEYEMPDGSTQTDLVPTTSNIVRKILSLPAVQTTLRPKPEADAEVAQRLNELHRIAYEMSATYDVYQAVTNHDLKRMEDAIWKYNYLTSSLIRPVQDINDIAIGEVANAFVDLMRSYEFPHGEITVFLVMTYLILGEL